MNWSFCVLVRFLFIFPRPIYPKPILVSFFCSSYSPLFQMWCDLVFFSLFWRGAIKLTSQPTNGIQILYSFSTVSLFRFHFLNIKTAVIIHTKKKKFVQLFFEMLDVGCWILLLLLFHSIFGWCWTPKHI